MCLLECLLWRHTPSKASYHAVRSSHWSCRGELRSSLRALLSSLLTVASTYRHVGRRPSSLCWASSDEPFKQCHIELRQAEPTKPCPSCRIMNEEIKNVILSHCFRIIWYAALDDQTSDWSIVPRKDMKWTLSFLSGIHLSEPSKGRTCLSPTLRVWEDWLMPCYSLNHMQSYPLITIAKASFIQFSNCYGLCQGLYV